MGVVTQPSSTMPLQLSSRELAQVSVAAGVTCPAQAVAHAVLVAVARVQVCVPGRQMPTPAVPVGPV
jgi:hypothetical protein